MRLLVLATGDIFLPTWNWLISQSDLEIGLLVSQPDRPVGRKLVLTSPRVVSEARKAGVPVLQAENLRRRPAREELESFGPFDLGIIMAYGQILTRQVIDIPRLGCWNLHASLLPRHRGAAPIQAAIAAGDRHSGITVMQLEPSLDAGPILHLLSIPLRPNHTGGSLHDELAQLAPRALANALNEHRDSCLESREQDHAAATHVGKLTRADGVPKPLIESAELVERRLRAYDPWPGSQLEQALKPGTKAVAIKLFPPVTIVPTPEGLSVDGHLHPADDRKALLLPCCDGNSLEISKIQIPGKARTSAESFLAGHGEFGD